MGLFGGIGDFVGNLLGGGGGSSSTQTSSQNTTVQNDVTVNFDTDTLAKAIEVGSIRDFVLKSEVAFNELTQKEKDQVLKENELKLSAMALQQQVKTDKNIVTLTIVSVIIAVIGLIYHNKKGK